MLVREAMTQHAEWIVPETSLAEVAQKMRDKGIGCLPVGTNDRMVGMITDRDLACRAVADGLNPTTATAKQVMTKGVIWCFDDDDIESAIRRMEEKKIHHMPVINHQKRLIGILSLSDLALRGPQELARNVSRLVSRDARHDAAPVTH
ncbi:MAG: CBS domain-containing protein [Alphaproteobacteria bacterium]|jgi:CBS domain-containing protein|nr:CBS domain-containing protein [Alphaproteobacteria bacterium]MDE1969215.1 CBS domain-containing protein [Alphaproteobacteria bacterium]